MTEFISFNPYLLGKCQLGFAVSVVDCDKRTSVIGLVITLLEIVSVLCNMQVLWIGCLNSRCTLMRAVYNKSALIDIGRLIDKKSGE